MPSPINQHLWGNVMAHTRFERFLPLSGVVAGLAFAGAAVSTGNQPSFDSKKPQKYVDWVLDHHTGLGISAVCGAYFAFFMLMFAAQLRASLRSGEAGESTYSSVAYAGAIGVAVSIGFMSMLSLALVSADEASVRALSPVADASWLPWAASSGAMMLGVGLGALRTLALPKWLAITTTALGVLSVTGPTGIGVFLLTPFWLIATGIVLARRQASGSQTVAADRSYANA
jgi:hypothetical protein